MRIFLMLILVVLFSSCVRNKNGAMQQSAVPTQTNGHVFEVTEVVQATSYTYMKVKENMSERWVAVNKQEANVGDVYYYDSALEMKNFESKDLGRTFDQVYFINQISKTPIAQQQPAMGGGMMGEGVPAHSGKVDVEQSSSISLEKSGSELTIAKIFADKAGYAGKEVEIRGKVVKVNNEIMGQNWVHIQDGTSDNGSFDLTITTQAKVNVGDEVSFKGTILLDKDFGAGYFYDVIMTDATLIRSKSENASM